MNGRGEEEEEYEDLDLDGWKMLKRIYGRLWLKDGDRRQSMGEKWASVVKEAKAVRRLQSEGVRVNSE